MSCLTYNLHNGSFKTEKEFEEFYRILESYINEGKIIDLGRIDERRFIRSKYHCQSCNTNWILDIPEQAFRRGWNEE